MGSIEKACISGFLCRLCSEMHRTVIHIYSDHGQRLCLVEKINDYLPITISPTDPLPKTICKTCLHRVEQHYSLLMRLTRMREERMIKYERLSRRGMERNPSVSSVDCSDEEESSGNTQTQTGVSPKSTETVVPKPNSNPNPSNSETHDESEAGPSNRPPKETGTGGSTGKSESTGSAIQELT
ncbi:uncharacterized protein LOC108143964 [Drosophila elegans]|uniref:uncharacterized protein LOC108143964 n=1 Tax=Drosophila elegans TaxID=30023 RepID=UPI001BC85657|nr:uncharacterized protein LOC108143964 [Drosophila elegans]